MSEWKFTKSRKAYSPAQYWVSRHDEITIELDNGSARVEALVYRAEPSHIVTNLKPYAWYTRFVVEGARSHHLPTEYVDVIAAFDAIEDPDRDRDRHERAKTCETP